MRALAARLGAPVVGFAGYVVALARFLVRTLATFGRPEGRALVRRVTYQQVYFTGVDAVPVVATVAGLLGAAVTLQTLSFLSGAEAQGVLGPVMQLVVVRELGPLMTALIVVGRSGSSITVELGNMNVLGELSLLESLGIDPVRYLVLPRMVGVTLSVICLCMMFDLMAATCGFVVAWLVVATPPGVFLEFAARHTTPTDLLVTALKTSTFGILIATISTFQGLSARVVTDVPQATRRCVVHGLVGCIAASVLISFLFYAQGLA